MFTSKFFLGLLLFACPIVAHTPAQLEPTEEQVAQMMEQMEEFLAMVQQVGGLYVVAVGEIPQHKKMAVYQAIKTASEHPLCIEADPSAIVFKSVEGKIQAQKLKAALEKLGCQTELIEMPVE